jgi:hypothetical protein
LQASVFDGQQLPGIRVDFVSSVTADQAKTIYFRFQQ